MPWGLMAWRDYRGPELPFIFLHGTGCDAADWDAVIEKMPAPGRYLNMEFRGHGASDVPATCFTLDDLASDTIALADHCRLKRYLIAGHSLGGMVGMRIAQRDTRVAGLVLFEGWTTLAASRAFGGARTDAELDAEALAGVIRKRDLIRDRFSTPVWEALCVSAREFDARNYLAAARIPILEIYGTHGRTRGMRTILDIPANRHIRIRWIAHAGHYVPQCQPAASAAMCRELLVLANDHLKTRKNNHATYPVGD